MCLREVNAVEFWTTNYRMCLREVDTVEFWSSSFACRISFFFFQNGSLSTSRLTACWNANFRVIVSCYHKEISSTPPLFHVITRKSLANIGSQDTEIIGRESQNCSCVSSFFIELSTFPRQDSRTVNPAWNQFWEAYCQVSINSVEYNGCPIEQLRLKLQAIIVYLKNV